jgi:hypothetical protein
MDTSNKVVSDAPKISTDDNTQASTRPDRHAYDVVFANFEFKAKFY